MAYDLNSLIIRGRLTRDPEAKTTQAGESLTKFSIANNPGKKEDPAIFIDCTAWGKTADTARDILQKGDDVIIEGQLKAETWTDKQTNEKRSKNTIRVNKINIVKCKKWDDNRENYGEARPPKAAAPAPAAAAPVTDEDFPDFDDGPGEDDIPF